MAVDLNIKTNQRDLQRKFKRFQSVLPRVIDKGLKQAGFQLVAIIREKTKKGKDFNDNPFAPYSESYLKRLRKEKRSTKVDLYYDGGMVGALTPSMVKKTGRNVVSLAFARAEERDKAFFNQVMRGDKNRKFFGFNKRTENIISKQFNRFVEKELRKFRI